MIKIWKTRPMREGEEHGIFIPVKEAEGKDNCLKVK